MYLAVARPIQNAPVQHIVKKVGIVMIKFNGIAWGDSYYFNVNWSPGQSRYLGYRIMDHVSK